MTKIKDIKTGENQEINLNSKRKKLGSFFKKNKNIFFKKTPPTSKIKDLHGKKISHYIYIKGKNFTPPKFLGNLLKIAGVGFLIFLIINSINIYYSGKKLEKEISAQAYEGYSFLADAGRFATKIQFDSALEYFNSALKNFEEAKINLWFITTDETFYAKENNIGYIVDALLESGNHFAISGKYFLQALEEFNKIPLYFIVQNVEEEKDVPSITETIKKGLEKTDLAIEEIVLASEKISQIDEEKLPLELKARIKNAKNTVEEVAEILKQTSEHFPALLKLLGERYPHRYLILFQNNNEIRPTGGFIGSYAILDISDGYITNLETYDVYNIDNAYGGYIEPHETLKNFTSNWRFRDSNYSPDFSVSGANARWFLQKQRGPTVDTVIGINQGLIPEMLEITGPIQVGDFGKIDSSNFTLLMTYIIEGKVWGPEDPKHILKVFVPEFKQAILKEEYLSRVASKLFKAIAQKHIAFYSSDKEIQNFFDAFNISGRVKQPQENEDYISVIKTSIGGTKSDWLIREEINHNTEITKTGKIINNINIKRTHQWTDDIYFQWRNILARYGFTTLNEQVIDILGRGRNKVLTKIYVPKDSILLESESPYEIETKFDEDLNLTYFFTEIEVLTGEEKEINITYELPWSLNLRDTTSQYRLIAEKQPGSRGSIFNKRIETDSSLKLVSTFPSEAKINLDNSVLYGTNLVYDRYFAVMWK